MKVEQNFFYKPAYCEITTPLLASIWDDGKLLTF